MADRTAKTSMERKGHAFFLPTEGTMAEMNSPSASGHIVSLAMFPRRHTCGLAKPTE
jgi:hypothetical protein